MTNPFVRKLDRFVDLSVDDRAALGRLLRNKVWKVGPREHILREGDKPSYMILVLDGWVYRYKTLPDGRRQIVAFVVPGDLCDLHIYNLQRLDHSIATLTPIDYVQISQDEYKGLTDENPRIARALWCDTLVAAAVQREWTVSIGQRSALERIAHLLLELFRRLEAVGLNNDNGCELPLTQIEMADAVGLTSVHTNRVLRELREQDLIEISGKRFVIHDCDRLSRVAMFNPNYLHLQRYGQ